MNSYHKVLSKLLNECVRIVTRKSRRDKTPTIKLYAMCNLKSINEIIIRQFIILIWEILHSENHPIRSILNKSYISTRLSTLNYFRTFGKSTITKHSFITPLIAIFNNYRNVICNFNHDSLNLQAKKLSVEICNA